MNYIIINGVNSNTLAGLMIQELPPITKPEIRTKTNEIDGRDGDQVEYLGYKAYDKKVRIGLYGNFDINAVIKFFDSKGSVTFSNEPDKYYDFTIIKEIDFNRLVRFRTADVTFHVQPFKYPVTETPVIGSSPLTVTNAGNAVALPRITVTGSGAVSINLNGSEIFQIAMGNTSTTITIDVMNMEATGDGQLQNRKVTGDYSNFTLAPGVSTITWSGSVTAFSVSNYTRWI